MAFPFATACSGAPYGPGPVLVEAPAVPLWGYGILSVATVIDAADDHERNGIIYKSDACVGTVQPWVDDCEDPPTKDATDTTDGEDNFIQGCPINLYAALSCRTTTLADMEQRVAEVFRLGEQKALETQIWNANLATSAATVVNTSSLSVDALTPIGAIAALESAISGCYGGKATIHADRGLAAYFVRDHQIDVVDGHYETALGTKVGFYGGSPNSSPAGVAAPDGFAWIYATSELTVRRFPIDILPQDVALRLQYINADGDLTNEPYILAERTYVTSAECCVFAALVCLSC